MVLSRPDFSCHPCTDYSFLYCPTCPFKESTKTIEAELFVIMLRALTRKVLLVHNAHVRDCLKWTTSPVTPFCMICVHVDAIIRQPCSRVTLFKLCDYGVGSFVCRSIYIKTCAAWKEVRQYLLCVK